MIIEETEFYKQTYNLSGTVFSDDGTGNPFFIGHDGKIYMFEICDNEKILISENLYDFFVK